MAKPTEALTFTNDANGETLTAEEVRHFAINTNDGEELRSLALHLLDGLGRMHRRQIEFQTKVGQWQREVLLRTATPAPAPSAPTVVIEPGAVVLTVPAPTFTFEAGALAVHTEAPRTGVTVDRDADGRIIGVTPKATP